MMIGRRQWMAGSAALATTLAAGPWSQGAGAQAEADRAPALYRARAVLARTRWARSSKVAAIGYREVEYGGGGYDKMDHAALRKTMDRLGLDLALAAYRLRRAVSPISMAR